MGIVKTSRTNIIAITAIAAASPFAGAQSLGSASDFDILLLNDGKIKLVDGNQLFGDVGYSDGSEAKDNKDIQKFDGTVFVHSGATFDSEPATFQPSGGIVTSAATDKALNQANRDVSLYTSYLDGLSFDANITGKYELDYNFGTSKALTVIDFEEVNMKSGQDFNLSGRAGLNDKIIFRISDKFVFEGGSVNLTNLNPEDIVWYSAGEKEFDLHKGDSVFAGTIIAPNSQVILGETSFTGSVIGNDLKLGSGFEFTGQTIPEPSSSLLLILSSASGLLLYRRRK